MQKLTSEDMDALTEIINIGVGKAAGSLSDIIGSHVVLKVPKVDLFPLDDLHKIAHKLGQNRVSSVLQFFKGAFSGSAALIFPPESAVQLVSALTGDTVTSPSLDSVRSGTLMEIGNIVINGILGSISNILKCSLDFSLPEYRDISTITELVSQNILNNHSGLIVFAEANFFIKALEISGFIVVLFEIKSLENLTSMIANAIYARTSDAV